MSLFKKTIVALMAAGMLLAVFIETVPAQDHKGHDMSGMTTTAADGPSTEGYKKAMDKMHGDMAIPYTGNADVDFVRGMIPHHQGAIDMAKVELEHGKDPEIRKLAEAVIKAQEAEIKQMQDWLSANAPK